MPHEPAIFLNIPVLSLFKSTPFYIALGLTKNPNFCSSDTTCMALSPQINVLLLENGRFQSFMPSTKSLVSGRSGTECLFCITVEKREDVDRLVEACVKEGGKADPTTLPEMGGGCARSIEDPDGHIWEVAFLRDMGANC